MHKVVFDTNILVSSLLASGPPASIIDLVAQGKIIPVYSDPILCEYWEVLSREKFGFSSSQVIRLMEDIARTGIAIEDELPSVFPMPDDDDRVFYDIAVKAEAYLITGNKKHFPPESFVISPADFLRIYQLSAGGE